MQNYGMEHDEFSVIGGVGASSVEYFLKSSKEIHCHVIKSRLETDSMIQTSLNEIYGKCGLMYYAEGVFNRIISRNIAASNAMIGGLCAKYSFSGVIYLLEIYARG